MSATRVTMLCVGKVGAVMASPSIRAYELGRVLKAAGAEVTLLAPAVEDAEPLELPCVAFDRRSELRRALDQTDVVVAQPQWPMTMRELRRSGKRLIFDLFYPDVLEKLERSAASEGRVRRPRLAITLDRFNEAMRIGHHFICGSERQVDLWLGGMIARGLVDPERYDRDPTMRSVIDVVGFGLPEGSPEPGLAPWGRFGIDSDDEVILWNGGIWPWMEPETAVRAMARVILRRPGARLVFMAGATDEISHDTASRTRILAAELGLLDKSVFFNQDWVPYAERGVWLGTADCALLCHGSGLEAHFSLHSRVLDCYWARLPVISTSGDVYADEIESEDLGGAPDAGDPGAIADAIVRVLERGRANYADRLEKAAGRHRWSKIADPLVRFALQSEAPERLGARVRMPLSAAARGVAYSAAELAARVRRSPTR